MQIVVAIESEIDIINSAVWNGFNILCSTLPEITFPRETIGEVSLNVVLTSLSLSVFAWDVTQVLRYLLKKEIPLWDQMGFDYWRPVCPLDLQTICHSERYIVHVFINPDHTGTNKIFSGKSGFEIFENGIYQLSSQIRRRTGCPSLPYWRSCEAYFLSLSNF